MPKNVLLYISLLVLGVFTQAQTTDLFYAPKLWVEEGKSWTPIDIIKNEVEWEVSENLEDISAKSKLTFRTLSTGYPFLLLNSNAKVFYKGKEISKVRMSGGPFKESQYYGMDVQVSHDETHILEFSYSFKHNPKEQKHILPLRYYRHQFVEQGIPANALYDRFPLSLKVHYLGAQELELIANGIVSKIDTQNFQVEFSDRFTSMSFYIDLLPKGDIVKKTKWVTSLDGRSIQTYIYSTKQDSAVKWVPTFAGIVEYKFHELEGLFGSYPQEHLILKVSNKPDGGGAYAGAMALEDFYMEDMSHEIGHNWFLQSVTPANGADTWIYEGLGDWAHLFGLRPGFAQDLNLKNSINLSHGPYKLWATPAIFPITQIRNPHQTGSGILASIDQFLKSSGQENLKGGLVPILKAIAQEKKHQTMSTLDFKALLEKHSGLNFSEFFKFYLVNE